MRIWPRPLPQINGPQWEEFCRVKVLLHVCHRDLNQLTKNDMISWSDLFNQHCEKIENEPDLLGPPVDVENESSDDETDYTDYEYEEDEEQI